MNRHAILLLIALAGAGCASAHEPTSCPAVDEEQLAARIADAVYERLRREGHLRTVGDEVPEDDGLMTSPGPAASTPE